MSLRFNKPLIAAVVGKGFWLVLLLCALFVPTQVARAGATTPDSPGSKVAPSGMICVEGTVIGHDEQPLGDGWRITATPYDTNGNLELTSGLQTQSDGQGNFGFDKGLDVGMWYFEIEQKPEWEEVTSSGFDVPIDYSHDCIVIRFKMRRLITVRVLKIDENHNPLPGWTIRADPGADNYFALPKILVTDGTGYAVFRLTAGNWTFTELAPPGVDYTPIVPLTGKQSLNVQPTGPYMLRFKNRIHPPNGCIVVTKSDVPVGGGTSYGLPGWGISIYRTDGTLAASSPTDAFGRAVFNNLPPGPYTVVEESRLGWEPSGPSRYDVTVIRGSQCVEIVFYNKQKEPSYCIIGRKIDTNGKLGLPNWKIAATPLNPGGYTPNSVVTNGLGEYEICFPLDDYRIPGAGYRVCEEQPEGWLPHTPTCRDVTLPLQPAAPLVVPDFENQQVGHYESTHPEEQPPVRPQQPEKPGCYATHTVKPGEYLSGIAAQYDVRLRSLVKANPWVAQRRQMYLKVGDQLCIP